MLCTTMKKDLGRKNLCEPYRSKNHPSIVWINVQKINAFIIPEFIISQNKQNDISIKMREVKTTLQEEKDRLIR